MQPTISTPRLYLLRAMYALMAVGLALNIWPSIIAPTETVADSKTVVRALLGSIGLLAVLGIRYPLRMIPLMLFEGLWKLVWLLAFALPAWRAGTLDATATQNAIECMVGVVLVALATPWDHVIRTYLKAPGEPWRPAPMRHGA